ncbi:hypothetical protein [Arthrobacter sp. ISL-5]|uniref:hypothetical protein n=1 Tax=Arthrobacter sp. ISL-5 TaxID=2819111 RepID=UPI001BE93082|nr:hypothetical protein [Arthrobacter sp. ISL-5]MBT2555507.1 hypothetical protein [Arthrobacter sp. ISL-5]
MALNFSSNQPKRINQLLTQEEKCFLDDLPQEAVNAFYSEVDGQENGSITGLTKEGVTTITLESPERVQAVKQYIDMLIELGVRERPE